MSNTPTSNKKNNPIIMTAITAVLAISVVSNSAADSSHATVTTTPAAITSTAANTATTTPAAAHDTSHLGNIVGMDRCYGVVKAGQNDCGNAIHSCSGQAKIDGDKNEWMVMPTGLCDKIVGGNTKPPVA